MKLDHLLKALLVALLLAASAWIATRTEWVDEAVPTPPKGEALTNELYATQQLVRQLGAKVVKPKQLSTMPPRLATLLLSSWHWDLFPERERLLRAWVQGGGHLVIHADMLYNDRLQAWLPVQRVEDEDEDDDEQEDETPPATGNQARAPASTPSVAQRRKALECDLVIEPEGVKPAYRDRRGYKLCGGHGYPRIKAPAQAQWAIEGPLGHDMVRMPIGQGSVTVITSQRLFLNSHVLEGDNALLAMAALQVRRGTEVWFVSEEARPPLLTWLWTQGWVAVLLSLLALSAALWRGAIRFGPLSARSVPGRRSIAEQIKGTAQFLKHHGADALHAAQVRALDETAQNHLRDYAHLERGARAKAIAKATGLDADALSRALDRQLKRSHRELPPTLELLETARRRLKPPPPPSSR